MLSCNFTAVLSVITNSRSVLREHFLHVPTFAFLLLCISLPPTDRVPFHAHTTHSATGALLSPGHVFGTVFRPTCATRTLRTAVSGVNPKRFVLMLLPGRNETFVNCAI